MIGQIEKCALKRKQVHFVCRLVRSVARSGSIGFAVVYKGVAGVLFVTQLVSQLPSKQHVV